MDEQDIKLVEKDPQGDVRSHWTILLLTRFIVPLGILAVGLGAAKHLVDTSPEPPHKPVQKQPTIVEIQPIEIVHSPITVSAMGTVMAAQQVVIQPQVSGEIIEVNPRLIPGGRLELEESIVRIDPRDYELAVQQAEATVAQAEYEIKVEMGYQEIAKREWELLGDQQEKATELDLELALRKPHLLKAQASLRSAHASLEKAQLNLERTTINAPFNGIVIEETIDPGAMVTPQSQLLTFVGTDVYWVQASVPVDRLRWIEFPSPSNNQTGTKVRIFTSVGDTLIEWEGRVLRLMGQLETKGRMARVLIEVKDPLGQKANAGQVAPLLIGAYVNLEFEGKQSQNVAIIHREHIRDNNTVWIMTQDNTLEVRPVSIVYRTRDTVLVSGGLKTGERIVVSGLPAVIEGMDIITRDQFRSRKNPATTQTSTMPTGSHH